jgi:hypothetical protein
MEKWFTENTRTTSLVLGLLFALTWLATRDELVLGGSVLLLVISLMGDRLKKAPGGWEFDSKVIVEKILELLPPPGLPTGTATSPGATAIADGTDISITIDSGTGAAPRLATADDRANSLDVNQAVDAMRRAETPGELAERVVEYVASRAGNDVWTPSIVVDLEYRGKTVRSMAIVDSGADVSLVPAELLETLGISFKDLREVLRGEGYRGSFEARQSDARLSWRGVTISESTMVVEPHTIPCVLLGRGDFFKRFVVTFDWSAKPPRMRVAPADSRLSPETD